MPLSPRGLVLTTSFHSGFITALFVVFVPLFSYLLEGRKPRVHQLVSLAIAVAGLYFLSKGEIGFDLGEFLTLICAILFGMHVVLVTIPPGCPRGKFAVLAVFDGLVHKWADGAYDWSQLAGIPFAVWVALFSALTASVYGIWAQLRYQKIISSNTSAVIFTMEPFLPISPP